MVTVSELKHIKIFSEFADEELADLADITEKMAYNNQEIIYRRGDEARYLFVIASGAVSLRLLGPGDRAGVAFEERRRGEMFGVAIFMEPRQYTLTALCLEDTEVLAIDGGDLNELCGKRPEIGYKLLKKVAQIYLDRYKHAKIELYRIFNSPHIITPNPS
ncbi:MAG: cyclic nucleotide-binding domain-containing protein [Deltaproteobacteria bacterium]|nr:cyclic nucleotide-binding domain-containing protein [Deltaproteobacteria bacterium]